MLLDILRVPFFISLFFSFGHAEKCCPTSYCGNNSFPITYPFKLHSQKSPNCSYTTLECNSEGIVILNLPYSGNFYVHDIDYESSMIQLYDPENCLPKRLMTLNLFSSSNPFFVAAYGLNYTFYDCPPDVIELSNLTSIDCLSNSSIAVVKTNAISRRVMTKLYRCNESATSIVPITGPGRNQSDFVLTWFALPCENCPDSNRGGWVSNRAMEAALLMASLLSVVWPVLICIACCFHCIKFFQQKPQVNNPNFQFPSVEK